MQCNSKYVVQRWYAHRVVVAAAETGTRRGLRTMTTLRPTATFTVRVAATRIASTQPCEGINRRRHEPYHPRHRHQHHQ